MARVNPMSVILFKSKPIKFINAIVPKIETGIESAETIVMVKLRKNPKIIMTAKKAPYIRSNFTSSSEWIIKGVVSCKVATPYFSPASCLSAGMASFTRFTISSVFVPEIFCTSSITPCAPL